MDKLGIGQGIKEAVHAHLDAQRRKGRTTQQLDMIRNGDIMFFTIEKESKRFRRLCAERGMLHVSCIYLRFENAGDFLRSAEEFMIRHKEIAGPKGSAGIVHFDHSAIESLHEAAIIEMMEALDGMDRRLNSRPKPEGVQRPCGFEALAELLPIYVALNSRRHD